jgi:hypothetical protein
MRVRGRRVVLWALAVLAVVLLAARLALNPFAAKHTREVLSTLKGYRGTFDGVAVSLWHLSYTIEGLKLVQVPTPPGGSEKRPFFYAKRAEIGLHWRDLIFRRELVGSVELDVPKLNLIAGDSKSSSQTGLQDPHLASKISKLAPLAVDRIEIKQGEVAFTDDTAATSPSIWVHGLDATLENLATRVGLAHGQPTTLAASGTLQNTGQLSIFLTADPFAKALAFSGRGAVEGLSMADVGNFLVQKADLAPSRGTIDLFAEFDAHDGRISGGVKPVLKHVSLKPAKGGVGPQLKAWIADLGLKLFSDRVPGRDAAAAVVPIQGTIHGAAPQLWPTIWGVLRNAFVVGLKSGFAGMPGGGEAKVKPQARGGKR